MRRMQVLLLMLALTSPTAGSADDRPRKSMGVIDLGMAPVAARPAVQLTIAAAASVRQSVPTAQRSPVGVHVGVIQGHPTAGERLDG